jgi:hypothetical protein
MMSIDNQHVNITLYRKTATTAWPPQTPGAVRVLTHSGRPCIRQLPPPFLWPGLTRSNYQNSVGQALTSRRTEDFSLKLGPDFADITIEGKSE